jgi:hypothetical protein
MAPIFRYRYVDFGTSFTGDPRERGLDGSADSPGTLFANALAVDVGGTCWGGNEPLPIIDHHFPRESQFPSASAAILHKASQLRERFAQRDVVWLVTHKEPDFDAFCSMYLARWIIETPDLPDLQQYGLHPNGWLDQQHRQKIYWFNPDLAAVPAEHRWAFLLAAYASVLETRRHIACPPQRALRSILYAAIKRGRSYLSETSGATEFFDAVKSVLQQQQLNPVFDSVLERSALFAPELAMLDRAGEAYLRDMRRARRSIVYLPESEAPSPDFFKDPRQMAFHDQRRASDLDAEHLLLADTFRIPTDGIYLRDPECLLFKEWARVDVENSTLAAGFEFTAIAYSNGRPDASTNKTDYQFSIDPERANGRHLYTVWSRLQTQEVEALRAHDQHAVVVGAASHHASSRGSVTLGSLLADPWIGGQSQYGNRVAAPQRGTLMGSPGTRSDLRDDPIAEAVRTELEDSIYAAASLVTGPQVTVYDLAGAKEGVDIAPQQYNLNAPLEIPAPPESYFRFAALRLRADVLFNMPHLARQIGETLWQILYPELPGSTPSDFVETHLVVNADGVGVWADRGIAVALKQGAVVATADRQISALRADFSDIVSLGRDVDRLSDRWAAFGQRSRGGQASSPTNSLDVSTLPAVVSSGEELGTRALQVKHALTLPDRDLFRRFYEANGIDQLMGTLHELTSTAAEHLRRHEASEQTKRMDSRADVVGRVQSKLEWLEVFIVGFFAVGIIDMITRHVKMGSQAEDALVLLGGPMFIGVTAWILKPWQRKKTTSGGNKIDRPAWIVIAVAIACVIAWIAGLLHLWSR